MPIPPDVSPGDPGWLTSTIAWLTANPAVMAAFIGFLGATLVNHWLANRRENIRRRAGVRALASALSAELVSNSAQFAAVIEVIEGRRDILAYDALAASSRVYSANTDKVGMLTSELAAQVVTEYRSAEVLTEHAAAPARRCRSLKSPSLPEYTSRAVAASRAHNNL